MTKTLNLFSPAMLRFLFSIVIKIEWNKNSLKKEILPLREKLFLYARRLLDNPEDAEDVMQEVFLKLWYMRGELDYYNNVMALSVQITKHLCLNRMKVRERTEGEAGEQFFICDASTPYTQLEQKDSLEHVMRLINKLPGLQQTILRMKHVDGFEVEEIAGLTGSTPEAVRMNLSRARKRVREQFFKMQTL